MLNRGAAAWAGVSALIGVVALLAWRTDPNAIDWQPAFAFAQPWRAWTAPFVHYSGLHLAANLAGVAVVAALGVAARVPVPMVWAWCVAWPLTQIGLLARPELAHFGGLSGVLHAGVAVVGAHLLFGGNRPRRAIGLALLAGLALKVLNESPWGPPLRRPPGWDIDVAPLAHAAGLLAGFGCAAMAQVLGRFGRIGRR